MSDQKKLILFDIDHTLFNTRLYQSLCYLKIFELSGLHDSESFLKACDEIYKELRRNGPFTLTQFIDRLFGQFTISVDKKEIEKIFADENIIEQALYDDAEKVLQLFSTKENTQLGIFSAGSSYLQKAKINSLLHLFQEEHIHINDVDKIDDIPKLLEQYQEGEIYVVDDLMNVLYSLKSSINSVTTILIERAGETKREPMNDFTPDYTIVSLNELVTIIK